MTFWASMPTTSRVDGEAEHACKDPDRQDASRPEGREP